MPPLQDSALHLYDARKTRLEVFFHFIIIIIIIIMDLVLRVRKAFIQVKYGLVSPMRYITALQSEMSFGYTFFFCFLTLGFHFHRPGHAQGTSSLGCKPTLVLLGKSVPRSEERRLGKEC